MWSDQTRVREQTLLSDLDPLCTAQVRGECACETGPVEHHTPLLLSAVSAENVLPQVSGLALSLGWAPG